MNQIIDTSEPDLLGHRLDCVRRLLTRDLDPWAKDYWTIVERALTRAWKQQILAHDYGLKTHKNQELIADYASHW